MEYVRQVPGEQVGRHSSRYVMSWPIVLIPSGPEGEGHPVCVPRLDATSL